MYLKLSRQTIRHIFILCNAVVINAVAEKLIIIQMNIQVTI